MSLLATDVMGNPQVGVYLSVVGDVLFHPPMLEAERVEQISSALELEPAPLSVGGSNLIGSLVAGNSHGLAVADIATTEDIDHLTSFGEVVVMEHGVNAAGREARFMNHQGLPFDIMVCDFSLDYRTRGYMYHKSAAQMKQEAAAVMGGKS